MSGDLNLNLKQKFGIKCIIDVFVFVITCVLFLVFAKIKNVSAYDTFIFLSVVITINAVSHFLSKHWINQTIKTTLASQSNTLSSAVTETMKNMNAQHQNIEGLINNTKSIFDLIEKLKAISESLKITSKNTERQVNQSINFTI